MTSKSIGKYYENKLVKDFTDLGYESWRVPLSGAIGENNLTKLPDRVRKLLIGDVCVNIDNTDIPIEVKFRSSTTGFSTVLSLHKLHSTTDVIQTSDALLFTSPDAFTRYKLGNVVSRVITTDILLNATLTNWLDKCEVLAIRYKHYKHWMIVLRT